MRNVNDNNNALLCLSTFILIVPLWEGNTYWNDVLYAKHPSGGNVGEVPLHESGEKEAHILCLH